MISVGSRDLWSLVQGRPQVDPTDLADAVQEEALKGQLDYRTRLLIRDSVQALREHCGAAALKEWLAASPARNEIEAICRQSFEAVGFRSLAERIMEKTDPETIRQFLRELSLHLRRPLHIEVGGSASLILSGYLSRRTEDIDLVDEVPPEIRGLHTLLAELKTRFGLGVAHFQSHHLPAGWAQRLHSQQPFGSLQVSLVDVYDVFLSKLFSAREKDRDDLRCAQPQLDKKVLVRRLQETTTPLRADEKLRRNAEKNWYILYGEPLPS